MSLVKIGQSLVIRNPSNTHQTGIYLHTYLLFCLKPYICKFQHSYKDITFTKFFLNTKVKAYIGIRVQHQLPARLLRISNRSMFQMSKMPKTHTTNYIRYHCVTYYHHVKWSCGHQVRQVGFLRELRFPPTRRPPELKHRCQ